MLRLTAQHEDERLAQHSRPLPPQEVPVGSAEETGEEFIKRLVELPAVRCPPPSRSLARARTHAERQDSEAGRAANRQTATHPRARAHTHIE